MKRNQLLSILPLISCWLMAGVVSGVLMSCNEKSEKSEEEIQPSLSVAVRSFRLQPNIRVMANLDSVFFSIDLDRGIIFNADSLPKGTSIERLVPLITFPSTVETAEITMTGGTLREGTVDYKKNPSDTLDFSGNVILKLTAGNGTLSREYRIKVNVHQSETDSLMWDRSAVTPLPSRLANPIEQKSVNLNGKTHSLIREADSSLTLATTGSLASARWTKQVATPGFTPRIRTLTATDDALYILNESGHLMKSTDGLTWSDTGVVWHNIIGGYNRQLLGISGDSLSGFTHARYPQSSDFSPTPVASDFPTDAYSNMLTFSSKWAVLPYAFIVGGNRDGRTLGATWAYDGDTWSKISNVELPPLEDATILPYFVYRATSTSWIQTEYSVTLCLGGRNADGSLNRTVRLSYDYGVTWVEADQLLQLPDYVPALCNADAMIEESPMESSLENWISQPSPALVGARIRYFVDGTDVSWQCPYIYMIGGNNTDGLNDSIWRAVLARLTFIPLF